MKKNYKSKIYITTDGYFDSKLYIKKPRNIVVVEQQSDNAVGVLKIHSKYGKNNEYTIKNIDIKPNK